MAHVKSGRVTKGSYLLVENLDRLSRENAGEATELFLSIVNKGVVIVQLSPAVMEFRKPVDMTSLMFAIVELSRGHSESAIKSERGKASWARKQKSAATHLVSKRLPGWISHVDGKLVLNEHATTVRRIYQMARDGDGAAGIAKKLNADGVPIMGYKLLLGKTVKWSAATVLFLLTTTATIGEYVPYRRGTNPGKPVPGYYPSVVDANMYHAVRAAITARGRTGRGRKGNHVNLLSGLLVDARDGGSLSYWHVGKHPAKLVSVNAKEGKGVPWVSFPAVAFERALRSKLAEVLASDIEGEPNDGKVEALRAERDEIDALVAKWESKMNNVAIVDTVAAKLAELYARRRVVADELSQAERDASTPLAESWTEAASLAGLDPDDDTDELRVKIRVALRRCIESVTCLFVDKSGTRTKRAAVRVQFRGSDAHRDFVIVASPKSAGACSRPATWQVLSFAGAGEGIDLRKPDDAKAVEQFLKELPLT